MVPRQLVLQGAVRSAQRPCTRLQARKSVVGSQVQRGTKAASGSPLKDGSRGGEPEAPPERSLTSFWDWHTVRALFTAHKGLGPQGAWPRAVAAHARRMQGCGALQRVKERGPAAGHWRVPKLGSLNPEPSFSVSNTR